MKKYFLCILILFPLTITSPRSPDLSEYYKFIIKEARYLICVINSEAIGQSYEEKLRTGSVVLNRVKDSEFPDSIEEVVCQSNQFSGINSKYFIIDNVTKKGQESIRAAWFLLKNGSILPKDVLYFHNPLKATDHGHVRKFKYKLFFKGDGHWYFRR